MKVHAGQTGTVAIRERQRRGEGRGALRLLRTVLGGAWTEPLPIWCWVIEHPEGVIVVDTGVNARMLEPGYFPRWDPYFWRNVRVSVRPEEEIGHRLHGLRIAPEEVRWVVLTHLHMDHDGGLHHFPNAEILVSREEHRIATGPLGKAAGYLPHRWPSERIAKRTLERVLRYTEEVPTVYLPSHDPGSAARLATRAPVRMEARVYEEEPHARI